MSIAMSAVVLQAEMRHVLMILTDIASKSCLANGVDHFLSSCLRRADDEKHCAAKLRLGRPRRTGR